MYNMCMSVWGGRGETDLNSNKVTLIQLSVTALPRVLTGKIHKGVLHVLKEFNW